MEFVAFGYRFGAYLGARRELKRRDEDWGEEWRTWPRVERFEDTGAIEYAEAFLGPLMLTMEYADTYWWDEVRLPFGYRMCAGFGYHSGVNRPLRHKFWISRRMGAISLGNLVMWFYPPSAKSSPHLVEGDA